MKPDNIVLDESALDGLLHYFMNEKIMESYFSLEEDIECFMNGLHRLMSLVPTLSKVYTIEKSISNLESKKKAAQIKRQIKEDLEYLGKVIKEDTNNY